MANYTVGDVREALKRYEDDTPVFGFVIAPDMVESGFDTAGQAEEWKKIVEKAEEYGKWGSHSVWDQLWDLINEAVDEVVSDDN